MTSLRYWCWIDDDDNNNIIIIISMERCNTVCMNLLLVLSLHCALASCDAVYCYRSRLLVCLCLWGCYHDNSKLRASILTNWVIDHLQLIKFWLSCPPGRGLWRGKKFLAPPYYSQRAVFESLSALFIKELLCYAATAVL